MSIRKERKKPRYEYIEDDSKGTDTRDWEGLPDLILEMIFKRLPLIDCISFSKVCKSWSNSVKQLYSPSKQSPGFPWLVMSNQQAYFFRSCYSVLEEKVRNLKVSEAFLKYFWGSFQDWLIAVKPVKYLKIEITLLNPFSGVKQLLPRTFDGYRKLVLSGSPLEQTSICMLVDTRCFSLWIPGSDEWCECWIDSDDSDDFDDVGVVDAIFFSGYFYLLTKDYNIHVIDAVYASSKIMREGHKADIKNQIYKIKTAEMPKGRLVGRYLVESKGRILLVCRLFNIRDECYDYIENIGFKVYRLGEELGQMAWIKMEDLGDQVLFVGNNCSRCFSTKELGIGLRNCIYFTNEYNGGTASVKEWKSSSWDGSESSDWGCFSLDTDKSFCLEKPRRRSPIYLVKPSRRSPIWLTAPLWWYWGPIWEQN